MNLSKNYARKYVGISCYRLQNLPYTNPLLQTQSQFEQSRRKTHNLKAIKSYASCCMLKENYVYNVYRKISRMNYKKSQELQDYAETQRFNKNIQHSKQIVPEFQGYESRMFYNLMLKMPQYLPYLVMPCNINNCEHMYYLQHGCNSRLYLHFCSTYNELIRSKDNKERKEKVTELLNHSCELLNCNKVDQKILVAVLSILSHLEHKTLISSEYYFKFCTMLNSHCQGLLTVLDTKELLKVCHCYRIIGNPWIQWETSFPQLAMDKLILQLDNLTKIEMVQVYYFISVFRKKIQNSKVEHCIQKYIKQLSLEELSIVHLAYFKTDTPMDNINILKGTINKIMTNKKPLDEIVLIALSKTLRYNSQHVNTSVFKRLLGSHNLSSSTSTSLAHFAHSAFADSVYDDSLISEICRRLKNELSVLRLKDLQKFLIYLSRIGYQSEDAFFLSNMIGQQLRNVGKYTTWIRQTDEFPLSYHCCIASLSIMNIYVPELLDIIAKKNQFTLPGINLRSIWNLWYVDRSVAIEFPDYKTPIIPPVLRKFIAKVCWKDHSSANDPLHGSQFEMLVSFTLKQMFDNVTCFSFVRILPHYARANLVLRFDDKGECGLPIASDMFPKYSVDAKHVVEIDSSRDAKWFVFEPVCRPSLIQYMEQHNNGTTEHVNGLINAKFRQLSLLGYIPVPIAESTWERLSTQQDRISYLRTCIYNAKNKAAKIAVEVA